MSRNNNMGMGNQGGGGGPLVTDYLQDLELEQELLQRKRELIQQQKKECPNAGQAAYNPPRQMCEDSAPGDRLGRPLGPHKRPRPGPLPSTRPVHDRPPSQTPRPAPLPSLLGPNPLMSFNHIPQETQNLRPRPVQPNFKQNAQPPGQNKFNLSPKKPTTSKPTPNIPPRVPVVLKEKENLILTADVKRGSKVNGLLEMALGIISKELQEAHTGPEHVALFGTPPLARLVRQGVRERLRAVMLGKAVDSVPNVLAEYRKAFPPSMDADLLKLTEVEKVDPDQKLAITLLEKDDPELYFKKNMTKLLEVKLDEMFQKGEKSYNDENGPAPSEVMENLPEVKTAPTEDSLKVDAEETSEEAAEDHPRAQEYDKWVARLLERKLPALLAKHKEHIIRLLDLDQMFGTTNAAVVMDAVNKEHKIRTIQHDTTYLKFIESVKDGRDPDVPRHCPYFAKVYASPKMPKHEIMQEFLNQFNPKNIRCYPKRYNVWFNNKEDFDNLLEADQTKIGNAKLTIVGSVQQFYKKKKKRKFQIKIKEEKSELDMLLTPQLDDQINDLLSAIRKDEDAIGSEDTNRKIKIEKIIKEEKLEC